MLTCYLRSSSIGSYAMCQQKYFINYVLGLPDRQNGKATMGSVLHKNLELLAKYKLAKQNKEKYVIDDIFGKMKFSDFTIENLNELSYAHYEAQHPGLMPKDSKKITQKWTELAITRVEGSLDPRNQEVFAVEEFFEIEIPHEWAKYSFKIGDEVIEGQLGIKGTVDLIVKEDEHLHVIDYKGLPIETPIPTPEGWSTMGDLKVGDVVFDRLGSLTRIQGKSKQSVKPCYEIKFDDGSAVICDHEHLWVLSDDSVVNIKGLKVGDLIDVSHAIACEEKNLPVDPYVLGAWLGNDANKDGVICTSNMEVYDIIEKRGIDLGKNTSSVKRKKHDRTVYGLTKELAKCGILGNRRIPEIYFRGSYNQRLDLLNGLIDIGGSYDPKKEITSFNTYRTFLAEDIKQLLLTLGYKPKVFQSARSGFKCVLSYGLKPDTRTVVSIDKVASRMTQCISVDSPDNTFLCTKNYIPTHNTGKRLNWATGEVKTYEDLNKDKQLLLYYYALRTKYPDKKFFISIYYINDHVIDKVLVEGGLFSFAFGNDDFALAEEMLKKEFEHIKNNIAPQLISQNNSHWKCKYLCAYSKIIPEISPDVPACLFIRDEIKKKGVDCVTAEYADLGKMKTYTGGGRTDVDLASLDQNNDLRMT